MGNQRFRFSDMIPNAWFYKLRAMAAPPANKKQPAAAKKNSYSSPSSSSLSSSFTSSSSSSFSLSSPSAPNHHRKSYHFSRNSVSSPRKENLLPPRKSSTRRRVAIGGGGPPPPPSKPAVAPPPPRDSDDGGDLFPKSLHPIVTKKPPAAEKKAIPANPSFGVKLRSPRIATRVAASRKNAGRRGVAQSFPVVKSSRDPRRDFRDSMVEMILENNLSESKEFEELLASYLSLNSDEYHELIIAVFKQIWIDFVRSSNPAPLITIN